MSAATANQLTPDSGHLSLLNRGVENEFGEAISFWPIEVSQLLLSLMTDTNPRNIEKAFLVVEGQRVPMHKINAEPNYRGSKMHWVQFRADSNFANLEVTLREVPELKRWNGQQSTNEPIRLPSGKVFVRAARFVPERQLSVAAKTFGTRLNYLMSTQNVSKSGLLIEGSGEIPPFKEGTILEIIIDPSASQFMPPMKCLAKVVRSESNPAEHKRAKFALQLIELDSATTDRWCDYVDRVERQISARI
jgi:hypothetical protein